MFVRLLKTVISPTVTLWRRHQTLKTLMRLNDRMLADIGFNRENLLAQVIIAEQHAVGSDRADAAAVLANAANDDRDLARAA